MTTTETHPTPNCGNPDHYDDVSYCPHCNTPICADWDNCDSPDAIHDALNCSDGGQYA